MAGERQLIGHGERAPDFVLPRGNGGLVRFYGLVGGAPSVLVLAGRADTDVVAALVEALRDRLAPTTDLHVVVRAAARDGEVFEDADGAVHGAYGASETDPPIVLVLDRNVRVTAVEVAEASGERLGAVVAGAVADATTDEAETLAPRHAPVLLVPDALDASLCEHLIHVWARAGAAATGVEASADGTRAEQADELRKRRRDHTVTDPELLRTLTDHLGRRLFPEVGKAFAYRATRFEGFKIACYEATDAGFFAAHRDNLSPATAHRRFALTLNLNEDYEGGELRFPEYGRQRYRPAAGEALVFSGSHLHEVLPVTRGRRFVLLSFLFSEEAARRAGSQRS